MIDLPDDVTTSCMTPYPIVLQHKMARLHGHLYLVPERMYFLCARQGGAWAQAVGQGIGGAIGGAIAAAARPTIGDAPRFADERALAAAMLEHDGSMTLVARDVRLIKYSLWSGRAIVTTGKTYGFPVGLAPAAQVALGAWAGVHGVATKGKALRAPAALA